MKIKIRKRTPLLFFEESEYSWCPYNNTVNIPLEIDRPFIFHIFAILHEFGHSHYKHPEEWLDCPLTKILAEKEAWEYAKRCVKEKYHELLEKVSELAIGTYIGTHSKYDRIKFQEKWENENNPSNFKFNIKKSCYFKK